MLSHSRTARLPTTSTTHSALSAPSSRQTGLAGSHTRRRRSHKTQAATRPTLGKELLESRKGQEEDWIRKRERWICVCWSVVTTLLPGKYGRCGKRSIAMEQRPSRCRWRHTAQAEQRFTPQNSWFCVGDQRPGYSKGKSYPCDVHECGN